MSKQSNLFAFFNRTPKNEACSSKSDGNSRKRNEAGSDSENESNLTGAGDHTPVRSRFACSAKRRRVIISSDEEEEEDAPTLIVTPKSEASRKPLASMENSAAVQDDSDGDSGEKTPKRKQQQPKIGEIASSFIGSFRYEENPDISDLQPPGTSVMNTPKSKPTSSGNFLSAAKKQKDADEGEEEFTDRFPHLDFDFLKPEKIRDARGRRPTDPDYDAKTLHVPDSFLREQTPGHKQWWKFKSEHYDTILFFKVGKFYELYHMDAVIAVEALNITYMRGKYAHCGFPEIGYSRFVDQLISRGHKVARIEQTETPAQLEERCKRTNVREKVVRREVCRLTTAATRTFGIQDGTDDREKDGTSQPEATYLMAITECKTNDASKVADGLYTYGVSFVDCTTGKFYLSQFCDDHNHTALRTLFAHNFPSQILYEKDKLSVETSSLIDTLLTHVPQQALHSGTEFWDATKTLKSLYEPIYFGTDWPAVFIKNNVVEWTKNSPPKATDEFVFGLSALGAIIWYLRECKIDVDLITMRRFEVYVPANIVKRRLKDGKEDWENRHMVLDGTSLLNLHVLPASALTRRAIGDNSNDESDTTVDKFSLFTTINHCATAFGRRQLERWICTPTCDPRELDFRQEGIKMILSDWQKYGAPFVEMLRKVPDMERLFQRIHVLGLKYHAEDHPDSRAQLFEATRYNQRKVKDLVLALDGLDVILTIRDRWEKVFDIKDCGRIRGLLICQSRSDKSDAFVLDLNHFKSAFDRDRALEKGVIEPNRGVDADYDAACEAVRSCEAKLNRYLNDQGSKLKCETKYVGSGKAAYQMEIPEAKAANLGNEYTLVSHRKGFKRYTTPDLEALKNELADAKERVNSISADVTRRVFSDFDERKEKWTHLINAIAKLDCILSLAHYAEFSGLKMCFPKFMFAEPAPYLEIRAGYHPALVSSKATGGNGVDDYMPNDCVLGIKPVNPDEDETAVDAAKPVMLLTGPNMGGKSTLMRQISSLVVLAQMGSMVPAEHMILTPVDRIFCRIGANDRLEAGQSTFFVELSETNVILREATEHSLVLIDELGRGTSTHDGTAIAYAVLKHIASKIRCRTVFSTHYHTLCRMVKANGSTADAFEKNIKLAHMACISENENTEDPTEENITFLYTLTAGPASKSYGFYTAKVAGIDVDIVRRAFNASTRLKSA